MLQRSPSPGQRSHVASRYLARLVNFMDLKRYGICTPTCEETSIPPEPLIGLRSSKVPRAAESFSKQSATRPWRMAQNYYVNLFNICFRSIPSEGLTS